MRSDTLIWIIILTIAAAVFFIIAAIVTVKGVSDLRDLLHSPDD